MTKEHPIFKIPLLKIGTTRMSLDMDHKLKKKLKLAAIKEGITMREFVLRIIKEKIDQDN